jgi:hypothetical protein
MAPATRAHGRNVLSLPSDKYRADLKSLVLLSCRSIRTRARGPHSVGRTKKKLAEASSMIVLIAAEN